MSQNYRVEHLPRIRELEGELYRQAMAQEDTSAGMAELALLVGEGDARGFLAPILLMASSLASSKGE